MKNHIFLENLKIALTSIKSQLLRTIITALIIAIGITSLVGMLTAVDVMKGSLNGKFSLLGANTFTIQNRGPNIQVGRRGKRTKPFESISFRQASLFKEKFINQPATVSVSYIASGSAQASYKSDKTNPNLAIWAADENYMNTAGYELEKGRAITESDVRFAKPVAIIGQEIKDNLFANTNPIGEQFEIGGKKYTIIGLLKEKGSSMGFGGDKSIFIPISKARSNFSRSGQTYAINVMATGPEVIDAVIGEASSLMRKIRKLPPLAEQNFAVIKSDNLSQKLIESLGFVQVTAIIIASITLFSASIALMNIMLVSVTERTKEIGIRKAIGAQAKTIRVQFLTEAIIICVLGGLAGIVFGLGLGNILSLVLGGEFIVPWNWLMLAIVICIMVGLISGLYPAYKASKLNPIDALRYE